MAVATNQGPLLLGRLPLKTHNQQEILGQPVRQLITQKTLLRLDIPPRGIATQEVLVQEERPQPILKERRPGQTPLQAMVVPEVQLPDKQALVILHLRDMGAQEILPLNPAPRETQQ